MDIARHHRLFLIGGCVLAIVVFLAIWLPGQHLLPDTQITSAQIWHANASIDLDDPEKLKRLEQGLRDISHRRWAVYYNWHITLEVHFEDGKSMVIPFRPADAPDSFSYFSGRWEYTAPQADPVVRELYDSLQARLRRESVSQDDSLTGQP